ncbi:family 20 glycosylhydrolase [Mycetocola zhadangensis]|uniref:beta-N-acetylhexosaminidase n=1 Tax=Mycetocola zhadangensis TaxID=1164595 RepID=A0A3L7J4X1_9MICO|nr:family 20 glycosylhydrolase [Mycetocola zhadangensis]RLQ85499.1 beta-N-acetylhexosaminidase [Mycetocola zhadangensis]GGE83144.1 beta-N-acetylhexosaminidase [Mycetocola zhadangensis]
MRHPTGSILPLPTEQHVPAGAPPFILTSASRIYATDAVASVSTYLATILRKSTGFSVPVVTAEGVGSAAGTGNNDQSGHDITLLLDSDDKAEVGDEGYVLETSANGALITAPTAAGLFYGVQSLRQLFPAELEEHSVQSRAWEAIATSIVDRPRFRYRGAMLDVARHFFDATEVCAFLDDLALFKINVLHLHLTDDQGWRLAIESRPELAEVGGANEVDGGPGGFYSRDDFARIVEHAAARFITIVPEIDVPGHTNAALSALPELNPSGKAAAPYTGTEVGFSSLDTSSETTWAFLDDVIREVAEQTPGPWLHFGGDESHATDPADYREFVARASRLVASHGKIPVAWHEAGISTDLAPGTVGQYWSFLIPENDSAERALSFVRQGGSLILSPADVAYLDMTYDESSPIGLSWAAGSTSVQEAYEWEPTNILPDAASAILGIEAPLWTETVRSRADIDYLVFPRLLAVAEIAWSVAPSESTRRAWSDFAARLEAFGPRFDALGIRPGGTVST